MSGTVQQLVNVRSSLAVAVEKYYLALSERTGLTPWYRRHRDGRVRVRVSAIAVPARVLKEVTRPKGERGTEGKRDGEHDESRGRLPVDPAIAALYEQPSGEKEDSPWEHERLNFQRAVILGGPGGGKTFLTQTTAMDLAQQGLEELKNRSKPLNKLPLPIWVELNDLAGESRPIRRRRRPMDEASDTLVALVRKCCYVPVLEDWVRKTLPTANCWLILDALDQVDSRRVARLKRILESIETRWQCRVLLTCRKANYNRQAVPWGTVTEYELAPFQPAEIGDLIARWHEDNEASGQKLNAVMARSYSLQQACRTPLVMTLACLANEEKELTEETRRVDLYSQVLRCFLRKAWRENPLSPLDPHIDDLLDMLRPMAWELFAVAPSVNQFPNSQVKKAIAAGARKAGLSGGALRLRNELLDRGLLIGTGLKGHELQYGFPHRSFQEFLVAQHLSRAAGEQGWEKAEVTVETGRPVPLWALLDKKSWVPEWQEAIIMLAGVMNDPRPLLELLKVEGADDLFRHRLALAAQCIGEVREPQRLTAVVNDVTSKVWTFYWRHSRETPGAIKPILHALPALAAVDGEVASGWPLVTHLTGLLADPDHSVRSHAARVLGKLGSTMARGEIVGWIVDLLEDPSGSVRSAAAEALGQAEKATVRPNAIDRLVECLQDEEVRHYAAIALGRVVPVTERAKVVDQLMACLRDSDWDHPSSADIALEQMGPEAARIDVVNQLLAWLRIQDGVVRPGAAFALGRLGPIAGRADVVDRLLECLRAPDLRLVNIAYLALAQMGSFAARTDVVDRLVYWLRDPEQQVRAMAADTLGVLGPTAARTDVVDRMTELLDDPDTILRAIAAKTFGYFGTAGARVEVVGRLMERLGDADPEVRYYVASALGQMGSTPVCPNLVDRLVECVRDGDSAARSSAVEALAALGPAAARPDVLDTLMKWLRDPQESSTSLGVRALGSMGVIAAREDVVEQLHEYLWDLDDDLRHGAADALGRLGPNAVRKNGVDRLLSWMGDPEMRGPASETLGRWMSSGARFFGKNNGVTICWVKDLSTYDRSD